MPLLLFRPATALIVALALAGCSKSKPPTISRGPAQAVRETAPTPPAPLVREVHFDFDRADIRPQDRSVLDAKIPLLRADPSIKLRIDGHTDSRGSREYNQALGLRRANATKRYLVSGGIAATRLETRSFGEDHPVDPQANEQAWAKNRRTEFQIQAPATPARR
ncbi:MAG: OmpA family protein [Gemmatimonadetes bacterium]|nr:OmpA family protein [Gemmatimonadota bacterium]